MSCVSEVLSLTVTERRKTIAAEIEALQSSIIPNYENRKQDECARNVHGLYQWFSTCPQGSAILQKVESVRNFLALN